MLDDENIGARIAARRKLRGLTQQQFADRIGWSVSLVRKVEQGRRPPTSGLVSASVRVLQVDRAFLTGQPYRSDSRRDEALHASVTALRRELAAYRRPPDEGSQPAGLTGLRRDTAEISRLRHRTDLAGLGVRLPEVLEALRLAAHTASGVHREQIMALWAEVYYAARQFLHKLGYFDLASLVADRYEWTAAQAADPRLDALASVFRAGELDAADDRRGARAVMAEAVDSFELARPSKADLSVWGFLHLMSAYMAAHASDGAAAWAHHAEAERAASIIGEDRDDYRLAFGPTNVAIWGTAIGVELMDGAAAIARAVKVHLTSETPPERAGHHYIDLARGQLLHGKRSDALESLMTARTIAPQQVRFHPMARETVYALARAERRSTRTLRGFAIWMGIQD